MIGLKRSTVRVVDHDPDWAGLGVRACRQVRETAGDLILDVQHVGSTAVADLPAKPILDLAVAVATLDLIPELIERLTAIGYLYCGDRKDAGGHFFVWESEPGVRTTHLHVVTADDARWADYLRFRDILRTDPVVRKRYADLKHGLRERFPDDRTAYTGFKHDFIRGVLSAKDRHPAGDDG